jgi:hypothetical protein
MPDNTVMVMAKEKEIHIIGDTDMVMDTDMDMVGDMVMHTDMVTDINIVGGIAIIGIGAGVISTITTTTTMINLPIIF